MRATGVIAALAGALFLASTALWTLLAVPVLEVAPGGPWWVLAGLAVALVLPPLGLSLWLNRRLAASGREPQQARIGAGLLAAWNLGGLALGVAVTPGSVPSLVIDRAPVLVSVLRGEPAEVAPEDPAETRTGEPPSDAIEVPVPEVVPPDRAGIDWGAARSPLPTVPSDGPVTDLLLSLDRAVWVEEALPLLSNRTAAGVALRWLAFSEARFADVAGRPELAVQRRDLLARWELAPASGEAATLVVAGPAAERGRELLTEVLALAYATSAAHGDPDALPPMVPWQQVLEAAALPFDAVAADALAGAVRSEAVEGGARLGVAVGGRAVWADGAKAVIEDGAWRLELEGSRATWPVEGGDFYQDRPRRAGERAADDLAVLRLHRTAPRFAGPDGPPRLALWRALATAPPAEGPWDASVTGHGVALTRLGAAEAVVERWVVPAEHGVLVDLLKPRVDEIVSRWGLTVDERGALVDDAEKVYRTAGPASRELLEAVLAVELELRDRQSGEVDADARLRAALVSRDRRREVAEASARGAKLQPAGPTRWVVSGLPGDRSEVEILQEDGDWRVRFMPRSPLPAPAR